MTNNDPTNYSSTHQIISPKDFPINLKRIKIQPIPIKIPHSHIELYPITYQNKNRPLLIQTPRLYLPFGLSKSSFSDQDDQNEEDSSKSTQTSTRTNYQLHLSLESPSSNIMEPFINQLNQIDQLLHEEYSNYTLQPSIRQPRDKFYPPFLRTKIKPKNFQIFDLFNQPQKLDYIIPGCWSTSIIHLKHLWVNNTTCQVGLTWYVLQSKVKTPLPLFPADRCLIDDPWENETFCSICSAKVIKQPAVQGVDEPDEEPDEEPEEYEPLPPEYEKYTRMLKLGIPILAVIQRCQLDGLDAEMLRNRHGRRITKAISNIPQSSLPPPPPMPNHLLSEIKKPKKSPLSNGRPQLPFNKADLLNSKSLLGKKEIKVKKVKTLKLRKRDPRVPSLHMILRTRGSLRSTRKPADFESDVK